MIPIAVDYDVDGATGSAPTAGANFSIPEEEAADPTYIEGAVTTITVNSYERNPEARQACLAHHGVACAVCKFNFAATYGDIGEGYIHVHHLCSLSTIKGAYTGLMLVELI